jgi:hypothetical protein
MNPVIAKVNSMPMHATWPRKASVDGALAMEG